MHFNGPAACWLVISWWGGGIADVELGCAVEEVGVDWRCIGDATVRARALASVPTDEGS
jgi:hypothetical protein